MQPETINPNRNFFNPGQGGNPNSVIDADRVGSVSSLQFPQSPQLSPPMSLANFSVNDAIEANNQVTQPEGDRKKGLDRIAELTKSLFNKPGDTQALEQTSGLPSLNKQLTAAKNQFRLTAAEQNQLIQEAGVIPLQLQQDATGRGITAGGLKPLETGRLRENAIKQYQVTSRGLFQQALIANISDDIAGAEKAVEKAIEYKYAPQEQEIAYLKDWLTFNNQDLTREDAKKAKNLEFILDERTRLLEIAKEDDKITQGFIAEAIKTSQRNGTPVPQLILQRASEAKTPNEALNMLSPYMVDTEAKANALLDRQIKLAQIDKIYADTALTNEQKNKLVAETQVVKDSSTPQGIKDQVSFLNDTLATAKGLASAAGPSGISRFVGDKFVGNTKFRQLETFLDTLKTNVLTLAADPDVKKFFGPQMTENDVKMMVSIGTTLNAQNNTPEQLTKELNRLETLFTKLSGAAESSEGSIPKGTDGASYGYPGYVSDGTQWVLKKQ